MLRFPFLLVIFLLIIGAGKIIPFLLIGFFLLFALGTMSRTVRYQPRPGVSAEDLDDLRSDVALSLLEIDDDSRLVTNDEARSRFEVAGAHYTKASTRLDRGVPRRDREAVARSLQRARYELEAASAAMDGREIPVEPTPTPTRQATAVAVQARPRSYRRRRCGW
jgi:hypothetical protein